MMKVTRSWSMPNKWTFKIKPIKDLLEKENVGKDWIDPFAGMHSPAEFTNDLNSEMNAQDNEDALDWLKRHRQVDGVLLDPPYSSRQISEHYKKAGIKVTNWHTSSGWIASIKNEATRSIKLGGKAICFGWNSNGLGKKRGFKMIRILLVAHGGSHNDTIVTVEEKIQVQGILDI